MATPRTAKLTIDGKTSEYPILSGTHGNDAIDIRALTAKTGLFAYDAGFSSTASCESKITFIGGDKGVLLYRGYPIEQLAEHCTFLEVAYLLKHGELPNAREKKEFEGVIKGLTMLHEQIVKFYQGFRRDAHPMAIMVGVVGALSAFYDQAADSSNPRASHYPLQSSARQNADDRCVGLQIFDWRTFHVPRDDLGYTANFLHMMFGTLARPTSRIRSSSVRSIRSSCCMPIMSRTHRRPLLVLRVPLEPTPMPVFRRQSGVSGGRTPGRPDEAASKCLKRLAMCRHTRDVRRAKDKNDSFTLKGFGHRIVNSADPRTTIMRRLLVHRFARARN